MWLLKISLITRCQELSSHVVGEKYVYNKVSTVQQPKIMTGYSQLSYQKPSQSTSDAAWMTSCVQKIFCDNLFCAYVVCMLAESVWLVTSLPVIISHTCKSGQELNTNPERDGKVYTSLCSQIIEKCSPSGVWGPSCMKHRLRWHPATWQVLLHCPAPDLEHTAR